MLISKFIKEDHTFYKKVNKYLFKYSFDRINLNSLYLIWISISTGFAVVAENIYWDFLFSFKYFLFLILISFLKILIDYYKSFIKIPLIYLFTTFFGLLLTVFIIDDRFLSSSMVGNIIFLTIFFYFSNKRYSTTNLKNSILNEVLKASSLYFIGLNTYFISSNLSIGSFFLIFPYICTITSILLVKPLYVQSKKLKYNENVDSSKKIILLSIILQITSILFSYYNNDPILSTSLAVILPFYFVAFFISKGEHIIRAYVYPILIILIFVSTKIPFIFISFFILFHLQRLINYFLYGKIYPTFKVTNDLPNF